MDNLKRDVYCILGLPFDVLNMESVIKKLHFSVMNNSSCFISTPNLNFLIGSQNDNSFRDSVINSDLSIVDGKPLVWLARLLNIPIPERVAGSDLIDELIKNKAGYKPLKVFFFGGEDNVAEIACEKLNATTSGLQCAGYLNPGFGSIEDMSSGEILNQINKSNADFIIVSLGAKKGQAWIEKNRNNLTAPIISHLGAVVNFVAGTVNRAPKFLQNAGLEWLWRVKEEPVLWKRYFFDGISFLYLIFFRVIPLSIIIRNGVSRKNNKTEIVTNNKIMSVVLDGACNHSSITEINTAFNKAISFNGNVEIILNMNSYIDIAFIASVQLLKNKLEQTGNELKIISKSNSATKVFHYSCCDYLLKN